MDLKEKVQKLRDIRQIHKGVVESRKKAEEAFRLLNIGLFDYEASLAVEMSKLDKEIREEAVEVFKESDERHPAPGVSVVDSTVVDYDPAKALSWAIDHKMALFLDVTAFNKIAKIDSTKPEFVTIKKVQSVRIDQDLSKVLGKDVDAEIT